MNQVFDNARTKVLSAFPSIYTKDDVIKLIDELQTEVTKQPQTDIATLEELKQNLLEALERTIDPLSILKTNSFSPFSNSRAVLAS
jgi:hypothetical protein